MPVHDWTRVDDGIFHAFHTTWVAAIQNTLNGGLLPNGYYALAEQHVGKPVTDVLTLHASPATAPSWPPPLPPATGGILVTEAPPRVRRKQTLKPAELTRRRSVAVRHVSGHHLVALIEIISPANKDRASHVEEFASKAASALRAGVHVLVVDLFPPGAHDPDGIHGAILRMLEDFDEPYDLPADEPMTLASYAAGTQMEANLEHLAVGAVLPEMPLFLRPDRYVSVPLESTYQDAYRGMPAFWRDVLEGQQPVP